MTFKNALLPLYTALLLTSCQPASTPGAPDTPTSDNTAEVAGMTAAEIQTLSQNYLRFPALNEELVRSGPHGRMVRTHLDPTAMQNFETQTYPYAEGAEIVKQAHNTADGPIAVLYFMKKIAGYDPANGDWFYAVTDASGNNIQQQGRVPLCISCHGGARAKDFVFGFEN